RGPPASPHGTAHVDRPTGPGCGPVLASRHPLSRQRSLDEPDVTDRLKWRHAPGTVSELRRSYESSSADGGAGLKPDSASGERPRESERGSVTRQLPTRHPTHIWRSRSREGERGGDARPSSRPPDGSGPGAWSRCSGHASERCSG